MKFLNNATIMIKYKWKKTFFLKAIRYSWIWEFLIKNKKKEKKKQKSHYKFEKWKWKLKRKIKESTQSVKRMKFSWGPTKQLILTPMHCAQIDFWLMTLFTYLPLSALSTITIRLRHFRFEFDGFVVRRLTFE